MSAFVSEAAFKNAWITERDLGRRRGVALDNLIETFRATIKGRTGNYQATATALIAVIFEDLLARTEEGL